MWGDDKTITVCINLNSIQFNEYIDPNRGYYAIVYCGKHRKKCSIVDNFIISEMSVKKPGKYYTVVLFKRNVVIFKVMKAV